MLTLHIKVKEVSCNHCVMAVTKALNQIDGIENVKVDLGKGEVTFHEKRPIAIELVMERIKKAGYEVE